MIINRGITNEEILNRYLDREKKKEEERKNHYHPRKKPQKQN